MKIHNLYGGAFIIEDDKGNIKYCGNDYIKSKTDIDKYSSEILKEEIRDLINERAKFSNGKYIFS